jgi:nucleotide-binding universal stress UspA family protein
MNTLKTILVAVDFSTASHSALMQASRLARLNRASLHVLHVVDSAAIDWIAVSRNVSVEQLAAITTEKTRQAEHALSRWMAQAATSVDCRSTIVEGVPLHEILEHVKILKPDLVVAGITGLGESIPGAGSLAHRLARKVPTKVLLVRADHSQESRKIVACIDFSETSREVSEQARRVAIQDGATVDFLHVWREPWLSMPYAFRAADEADFAEERQQVLRDTLTQFVSETAPDIKSNEVLVNALNYGNGITAYALEAKADLIVVGNKGRTNLRYVLLGSTAERLLTKLPCSLLVVKPTLESPNA